MHKLIVSTLILLWLWGQYGIAQRDYRIYLQSGVIAAPELLPTANFDSSALAGHKFAEYYYLALQFPDIPDSAELSALTAKGVELYDYLPNYAYIAKVQTGVDWNTLGIRALTPLQPAYKLSPALLSGDFPTYAVTPAGVLTQVHAYPSIPLPVLLESLQRSGFENGKIEAAGIMLVVAPNRLLELAKHPAVMYVELPPASPQAEGWIGRTAHRINLLGQGPQQGLDGQGVVLAIADDGKVAHEDFRGRLTDLTVADGGTHGDMTAGIAVGAGNLNPLGMGMAPSAHLYLYPIDHYPHLAQAPQNLQQRRVVITSTSYGEGCSSSYDYHAQILDAQVYQHPAVLHVFSAGNSGRESCSALSYFTAPDGGRFGNITGGRKTAKNTLAVGNTSYNDQVIPSSSRGPTLDWRIKPDLVAHGQGQLSTDANNGYRPSGGTSAAAPGVAGAAALLYQAYRQWNGNQDPSSALIKAVLLNTADDLGNPGPDYVTGWGRVNAGNALTTLQQRQYFTANVDNNAVRTHTINVPPGVRQVRIMLYWHDPEGSPIAGRALVNDLDLTVQAPGGTVYLPLVLSTVAHQDSINKPAYRGLDRVNNAEQVIIDAPASGVYTIVVNGYLAPRGPQEYVATYHFIMRDLAFTYPVGGEGFVPGETEVIRWDAQSNTGNFSLEYSTNNGASWQLISNNIPSNQRHYDWQIPVAPAAQVRLRLRRNEQSVLSPQSFCILALPEFDVVYFSPTQALLRWRKVPGSSDYEVFTLGEKYMESIGTTADTVFPINIQHWQSGWYSVRARHVNGVAGRRANAKWYQHRPCETQVTLRLRFDLYPAETFWEIKDDVGRVWASGGPYTGETPNSTINLPICLPFGCYSLNVHDAYGNGMCCSDGAGSYTLSDVDGKTLAAGGQFGSIVAHNFCVNAAAQQPLSVQIQQIRHLTCPNSEDGAATAVATGGNGNYTFRWSNGSASATLQNLTAGNYSVTVTDGNLQATASVVILSPPPIDIHFTTQTSTCHQPNAGSIRANVSGGAPPYRYRWSTGATTAQITGLSMALYRLTVTDANGCIQTAEVALPIPSPMTVQFGISNVSCPGGNDGRVFVQVNGGAPPYRFAWSNGSLSATATGLSAGIHAVTVTDQMNCQATAAVNILQPLPIVLQFAVTAAFGTNNGAVNLSVSGGTPDYTYRWSNGATTKDLTRLGPGTYNVTVTDRRGCVVTGSAYVEFQDPAGCTARGSSTRFEWIESVTIGALIHHSGDNNGYSDFTNLLQPLTSDAAYLVALTPGYSSTVFREYWRIWIDLNQDGDFLDEGEEVFAADGFTGSVGGMLRLPAHARPGRTRLRIAMRYGAPAFPCGVFAYGEVEDYSVLIMIGSGLNAPEIMPNTVPAFVSASALSPAVSIFPNPADGSATLRYFSRAAGEVVLTAFDRLGRVQWKGQFSSLEGWNNFLITMSDWPPGAYLLRGESAEGNFAQRIIRR